MTTPGRWRRRRSPAAGAPSSGPPVARRGRRGRRDRGRPSTGRLGLRLVAVGSRRSSSLGASPSLGTVVAVAVGVVVGIVGGRRRRSCGVGSSGRASSSGSRSGPASDPRPSRRAPDGAAAPPGIRRTGRASSRASLAYRSGPSPSTARRKAARTVSASSFGRIAAARIGSHRKAARTAAGTRHGRVGSSAGTTVARRIASRPAVLEDHAATARRPATARGAPAAARAAVRRPARGRRTRRSRRRRRPRRWPATSRHRWSSAGSSRRGGGGRRADVVLAQERRTGWRAVDRARREDSRPGRPAQADARRDLLRRCGSARLIGAAVSCRRRPGRASAIARPRSARRRSSAPGARRPPRRPRSAGRSRRLPSARGEVDRPRRATRIGRQRLGLGLEVRDLGLELEAEHLAADLGGRAARATRRVDRLAGVLVVVSPLIHDRSRLRGLGVVARARRIASASIAVRPGTWVSPSADQVAPHDGQVASADGQLSGAPRAARSGCASQRRRRSDRPWPNACRRTSRSGTRRRSVTRPIAPGAALTPTRSWRAVSS